MLRLMGLVIVCASAVALDRFGPWTGREEADKAAAARPVVGIPKLIETYMVQSLLRGIQEEIDESYRTLLDMYPTIDLHVEGGFMDQVIKKLDQKGLKRDKC